MKSTDTAARILAVICTSVMFLSVAGNLWAKGPGWVAGLWGQGAIICAVVVVHVLERRDRRRAARRDPA